MVARVHADDTHACTNGICHSGSHSLVVVSIGEASTDFEFRWLACGLSTKEGAVNVCSPFFAKQKGASRTNTGCVYPVDKIKPELRTSYKKVTSSEKLPQVRIPPQRRTLHCRHVYFCGGFESAGTRCWTDRCLPAYERRSNSGQFFSFGGQEAGSLDTSSSPNIVPAIRHTKCRDQLYKEQQIAKYNPCS